MQKIKIDEEAPKNTHRNQTSFGTFRIGFQQ